MKFMENLKKKKANNKGFSLVELIIVIAIMAILVGIVGTQVVPYLNQSKASKDLQIVSSYSTAAMTAYSANAGEITIPASNKIEFTVYGTHTAGSVEETLAKEIQNYTYAAFPSSKFNSKEGATATDIKITYDFATKTITALAVNSSGTTAGLDSVVSDM